MDEPPLLLWLHPDGPVAVDPFLVGGKGGAIARLIAAGETVPRSAVLTTAAYRTMAATPSIHSLRHRIGRVGAEAPSDEEIDQTFLDAPMPPELSKVLAQLSDGFDRPVSVRSSATAEDLASAAFAGQYRTVTDVEPERVEHAVRLVWASLWHAAPRTYRHLRGLEGPPPTMAVLVMEMIDASWAGVLFTRDPVGDETDVRVELVEGCGEALVSGAATPAAHTWARNEAGVASAGLGIGVQEVVRRGLALEAAWGTALDIEFALDSEGRPWLLQARPITTLDAATSADLTSAGIAEMLPGVLPPLLQATAGRHVDEGFRDLLDHLGADLSTADGRRFVRFVRSRARLDLATLRCTAATVPGGSAAAVERGIGRAPSPPVAGHSSAAQIVRVMRRRREAVLESEIVIQAVDRLACDDGAAADGEDDADERDLFARWERVQDLGARATAAEMAVATLATAAHEGVERVLGRHLPPDRARELAHALTTLREPQGPLDRSVRSVGLDPSQPPTEQQWSDVLARSGSRSVFGGATWAEDPELAWLCYADVHPASETAPATSRPETVDVPITRVRRRFVRREASDAAELLDRRERTKQALLDLGGVAHRLTVRLAEHLVARSALDSIDDVWLLTPTELRDLCGDGVPPIDLEDRRALLAADRAAVADASAPPSDDRGWPASPGVASGRAVVVDVPRAGSIGAGDVLVARSTDASWAPLFARAAAIVVEEGGPLSHASIVARELGVPAVVNLPGIVDRIRRAGAGAVLEVDGTSGSVTIVEPLPSVAPVIGPPEDEPRLGVFVTGLIGASALLGAVVSVTEAVSSARGLRRTRARAAGPAVILAETVRHGTDIVRTASNGLVPAARYLRWAVAATLVGLGLGAVAVSEYVDGSSGDRVLWLVTALSVVPAALVVAQLLLRASTGWPDVPPVIRRATPAPRTHTTTLRQCWYAMPALHRRWMAVFGTTAVSLLVLNVMAPEILRKLDEAVYDAVGAPATSSWGPEWFGMVFGRPQVAIPIAVVVALLTIRCRVLVLAYPITIMFGGLLNLGLGALVGKHRPPLGAHADQFDSFPSGHAIEVTLLLGLAPLAVAIVLRSRWAGRAMRLFATGILAVMLIDGLRDGSHWPTDHLAGFAIAMIAVVLVHAVARTPPFHRSCARCPAMALERRTGPTEGGGS